jgi:ubiquinone/menaquinone biosynthesis C-methylase UbiE
VQVLTLEQIYGGGTMNRAFLSLVVLDIKKKDPLQFKQLQHSMRSVLDDDFDDFNELHEVVCDYFKKNDISPEQVADDYLRMIKDMRKETAYFIEHGSYSCKSQEEALKKVYSQPKAMEYYLNALLVSNLLWVHHLKMLLFFKRHALVKQRTTVLDIGSGHGLYSYYARQAQPDNYIDIVDISNSSLKMTRGIVGDDRVQFYKMDVMNLPTSECSFDLIILGEVLEHVDDPKKMIDHVKRFLRPQGVLWVTVPTNAPAVDHVYLFDSEKSVLDMLDDSGLRIVDTLTLRVDSLTELIGAFCMLK